MLGRQTDKRPPVLLVDGYNVIMQRTHMEMEQYMEPQTLADARERLINDTRDYAFATGCRAIVVFDAFNSPESLVTQRYLLPLLHSQLPVTVCRLFGPWLGSWIESCVSNIRISTCPPSLSSCTLSTSTLSVSI